MPADGRPRWGVYCSVVDNFGDAGIAWRLARELATEFALDVTLWIDPPDVLAGLVGADPVHVEGRRLCGVLVRQRSAWTRDSGVPDVIVDVLGGGVPDALVHAIVEGRRTPRWFVLEYLSAEPRVEGLHGLPSPHPSTGIPRTFWFPGFTVATGGLLRECDLLARRAAFTRDAEAQHALWQALRVPQPRGLRVSVFCYPHAPLAALLDAWAAGGEPVTCLVPEGVAPAILTEWTGSPRAGAHAMRGALALHVVPFVTQDRYDELLWACDLNLVRGEDSFVRAQWAAQPLVWNIYAQEHDAHHPKLHAFLARYGEGLDASVDDALGAFWGAWNGLVEPASIARAWSTFARALPRLATHARAWADRLARLPELAHELVKASRIGV